VFDLSVDEADIEYRMDDVTEYHLGAEYTTFVDRRGWSVRFGWWRDQTHLPFVDESFSDPRGDEQDAIRAQESFIRAPLDDSIDHFTVGARAVVGRRSFGSGVRLDGRSRFRFPDQRGALLLMC
jgi:hypothetical protein